MVYKKKKNRTVFSAISCHQFTHILNVTQLLTDRHVECQVVAVTNLLQAKTKYRIHLARELELTVF